MMMAMAIIREATRTRIIKTSKIRGTMITTLVMTKDIPTKGLMDITTSREFCSGRVSMERV